MSKKTKALDVGNFGLENTKAKGIIYITIVSKIKIILNVISRISFFWETL